MHVTPIGMFVLPVSFAVFFFFPGYLGPLAILFSAFQAASVFNVEGGPIGITPYFFVLILIMIRFFPLWLGGKLSFTRRDVAIDISRPLIILTFWSVTSSFLLPWIFAGVGVDAPRAGMDSPHTTPLQWGVSNVAQASYAALNGIFVIYLLWCGRIQGYFERLVWAFVGAGLIAASIGAYQYVAHYSGLPYPSEFFNSNPGWRQLITEQFGGVWRLSATFSEPSAAGPFFAVWATLLLFLAADPLGGNRWAAPLCLIGIVMVFLTTSTTGYFTGALVIALFLWKEFARIFTSGKISMPGLFSLLLIAGAFAAASLFIPNFREILSRILFDKAQSQSSRDRTTTIWEALQITRETYGLGAGIGSNRPSGMLFYIASNLGFPGLLLFASTIWAIYQTFASALRANPSYTRTVGLLSAMAWATAIELVAMSSAGGDMSSSLLWVCLSVLATGSRALWLRPQKDAQPIVLPESRRIGSVGVPIILTEEFSV